MNKFQESHINFHFQAPQWDVVKYDESVAHKKVEKVLKCTKAVDFVGIHNNERLFLIEVKNYRGYTYDETSQNVLRAGGEELMQTIASKVRDTIATATNAARFSTNDEAFYSQINSLLLSCQEKIVIIACIEQDARSDKELKTKMGVWTQKLKQKLSWLQSVTVSVNSVDNIAAVLPDTEVSFA